MTILPRLLLLHPQATSGRLWFFCLGSGVSAGVSVFGPLPWVDTPEGDVPVLLAAFTGIDQPFAAAEEK